MTNDVTRGIYDDGYLFEIAIDMLDSGKSSIEVADHLMTVLGATEAKAVEIIGQAWGP